MTLKCTYIGQVNQRQQFKFPAITPVAQIHTIGPGWARVQFAAVPLHSDNDPSYVVHSK